MIWTIERLMKSVNSCPVLIDEKWVPLRPSLWKFRSFRQRISEAWAVFCGTAEAFEWPGGQ